MSDTTETTETATKTRGRLSAKDEVRALLDRLPDDVTLEDIQYHLDVVVKVLEAEASLERGEGITQEEFDRRFAKWLTK
jgi:cell division septum initiation protein DivIVA